MLMIGSDIIIMPPNISEGVSRMVGEKLGIKRDQLFFGDAVDHPEFLGQRLDQPEGVVRVLPDPAHDGLQCI